MHLIKNTLFFALFLSNFIFNFGIATETVNFTTHLLSVEECLLPANHPLQQKLKNLFKDPHLFESRGHFHKGGFSVMTRMHRGLMVASHPSIKGYLIKKFSNNISQQHQLTNFVNRINGARFLREFIVANQLKHIIVPQKWLYPLPKRFADPVTKEQTYVLIVEKMNILPGGRQSRGESAKKYRHIDLEVLKELCTVLYYFRGLDSMLDNMPFTRQNQIAFIDTEKWNQLDREYLHQVMKYLSPDRQKKALEFFHELSQQNL